MIFAHAGHWRRALIAAVLVGLAVAFMWGLAWHAYQSHFAQRAANEAATRKAGDTPFQWDFTDPTQVIQPGANGLKAVQFGPGGLYALVPPTGGNVALRFNDRLLPSELYNRLRVEIEVSAPGRLDIYWRSALDGPDYGNTRIRLKPGLNRVDVDLRELSWRRSPASTSSGVPSRAASMESAVSWGGSTGIVRALRLHPGRGDQFAFNLRQVRIEPASRDVTPAAVTAAWDRPWNHHPLTPENARWRARQHLLQNPASIILPFGMQPGDLPPPVAPDRLFPPAPSVPPILWILALAFMLAAALRVLRPPAPRHCAAFDLSWILIGALFLLLGVRTPDALPAWTLPIIAGLGLLVLMGNTRGIVISKPAMPDRKAWLFTGLASAPLLLALLPLGLLPDSGARWSDLWPGVLIYTGWALIQQFILGPILAERWRLMWPRRTFLVAGLSGLIFGLFHYPNFALMTTTFVMGVLWARVYLRFGCILPQAIMHALLGSLFFALSPPWLLQNAAVGIAHFK